MASKQNKLLAGGGIFAFIIGLILFGNVVFIMHGMTSRGESWSEYHIVQRVLSVICCLIVLALGGGAAFKTSTI